MDEAQKRILTPDILEHLRKNYFPGFNEREFEQQMEELGDLILLATVQHLLSKKSLRGEFESWEEVVSWIENNCSQREVAKALNFETKRITDEYSQSLVAAV